MYDAIFITPHSDGHLAQIYSTVLASARDVQEKKQTSLFVSVPVAVFLSLAYENW
jgi:hypothetical protein